MSSRSGPQTHCWREPECAESAPLTGSGTKSWDRDSCVWPSPRKPAGVGGKEIWWPAGAVTGQGMLLKGRLLGRKLPSRCQALSQGHCRTHSGGLKCAWWSGKSRLPVHRLWTSGCSLLPFKAPVARCCRGSCCGLGPWLTGKTAEWGLQLFSRRRAERKTTQAVCRIQIL